MKVNTHFLTEKLWHNKARAGLNKIDRRESFTLS